MPATIVYDRTKTVVRKHLRRNAEVPLPPEAIAFAAHYRFDIVVAPARRPRFKGRVERRVSIVRMAVLDGRALQHGGLYQAGSLRALVAESVVTEAQHR